MRKINAFPSTGRVASGSWEEKSPQPSVYSRGASGGLRRVETPDEVRAGAKVSSRSAPAPEPPHASAEAMLVTRQTLHQGHRPSGAAGSAPPGMDPHRANTGQCCLAVTRSHLWPRRGVTKRGKEYIAGSISMVNITIPVLYIGLTRNEETATPHECEAGVGALPWASWLQSLPVRPESWPRLSDRGESENRE